MSAFVCSAVRLRPMCPCVCVRAQDHHKGMSEEGRRRDEELDRQALLAEQRREEERLLQEEQQREKMERIRAVEGKMDGRGGVEGARGNTSMFVDCIPFHVLF